PAVVQQRPQLKGRGGDIELFGGPGNKKGTRANQLEATRRANQVEAIGDKETKFAIEEVNRREVRRDNSTFEFHRTPEVENPSAVRPAGGGVVFDDWSDECQRAVVAQPTARPATSAARDRVAADRADHHGQRVSVINAAAEPIPRLAGR